MTPAEDLARFPYLRTRPDGSIIDESYTGRRPTPRDASAALRKYGGIGGDDVLARVAVAIWESDRYELAYYVNRVVPGDAASAIVSVDRGYWQANSFYEAHVSDSTAFSMVASSKWAATQPLDQWVAWTNFLSPEGYAAYAARTDSQGVAIFEKIKDVWQMAILGWANERARYYGVGAFRRA